MASAAYENARKKREAQMFGGIKIVFPAFDDLPSKTLRWGTANFETEGGEEYQSVLSEMPETSSAKGATQDFVEFAVNDPQSVWYETVKPYEDVFEDTRITVREFLLTENDVLEAEITLEGFLERFSINEADFSMSFSGISDASRTGFPVGGRILSQRFCAAVFNKNGMLSPLIDPCGWQTGQGGNPLFCTRKRTGPDGCEDHNNAHRIVAVEGLTSAEIQYVASGGIGGGGWEYGGGGPCFTKETLVWMADGSYKPIWKISRGDLVWSFDPKGARHPKRVLRKLRHRAEALRMLDFGKDRLIGTTAEHLFLTGDDLFNPADRLTSGDTVRTANEAGAWSDLTLRRAWDEARSTCVHNFHVEELMTYFVVVGAAKIGVHNLKDIYPDLYPQIQN